MASEDEDAIARLTAVLTAAAGAAETHGPVPRELAELLWFARQLHAKARESSSGDSPTAAATPTGTPSPPPPSPPPLTPAPQPLPAQPPPPAPDGRVPLHVPPPEPPTPPGTPQLLAPAPPMLPHPLALQRALRPLKRPVPSPRARILDERATADRIARLGARPDVWLPVLRPAPDRWLRLNLVYDAGPTMPIWRPLVRELHTALAQSGVFRTVTLHRATPDGRAHQVPAPADGRTVTLVVSDCMGPQWRPGPAGDRWYGTLRRWARRMPLAVVQPLPEHLWPTTALPAEPGLLTAPMAAAPNATLTFTPYDADQPPRSLSPLSSSAALTVPVLEAGPAWLANWSALIAAPGGARVPGAAARLERTPPRPTEPAAPDIAALPPRDLVLHFRATASPEAFRLAGHLSLSVPTLPVMRLVQRALDTDPRPQHLAEVILSGMLTAVPGPPGSYDFRPGVRDLLQRTLPRTARGRTREFLARVGGSIDERAAAAAGEFRVEAGGEGAAFATVTEETVRRLGAEGLFKGRYRPVGVLGSRMWEAVDVRTGQRVVVHEYAEQTSDTDLFLTQAAALAELRHPNVVPVADYGVEDARPYLVTELLDGVTVAELVQGHVPGVSDRVYAQIGQGVEEGLDALHKRRLTRGDSHWDGVLLRPDGTAVITRFALGTPWVRRHSSRTDLHAFRVLLEGLARRGIRVTERLRISMLGPLRVGNGNRTYSLPSPQTQAMLCMLLLKTDHRASTADLTQGIWEQPPSDPPEAQRSLAGELRNFLGPTTLAELPDGYALHSLDAVIDVIQCEQLLTERSADQPPRAQRTKIQQALDLWYGNPLDGIPGPAAQATRTRLRTLRLTLCATRAELDLELGDFAQAAADLAPLVQEHPDREDFRRLHILALKNQGRIAEALEAYEAYQEQRQRQYTDPLDPLDPVLQELHRELREAAEHPRPTIVFELPQGDDPEHPLGETVTRLMARGDLPSHQYEILARDNGYVVLTEPDAYVLPVLVAVLRGLPEHLATLDDPPQVRVTFWHSPWFAGAGRPVVPPQVQGILDESRAEVTVLVSPTLYDEFEGSSAGDAGRFRPLWAAGQASPVAWYCPIRLSPPEPTPAHGEIRDLVRGPFSTWDVLRLDSPDPGRTAVVLVPSDGPMMLLNPAHPWGKRPPRPMTYYEVDLTIHQAVHLVTLPSAGGGSFAASVELSWHVDDPVAFLRSETENVSEVLLGHLLKEAPRLTRRYPLGRGGAAQQALRAGLRRWPVSGLSVTCSVGLTAEGEPAPVAQVRPPSTSPLAFLLRKTEAVLIGFDGPLTRLFTTKTARAAALELLTLAVEERDPDEALAGRSLDAAARDELVHPLEVLRAFANSGVGPALRRRLDDLELRAVPHTHPTPDAHALIRALTASGHRVEVVTDACEQAAQRCLAHHSVPPTSVHGRSDDLTLLMPNPDCLLRALPYPGRPAPTGLLITSSVAEYTAATRIGLRCIGFADIPASGRRLRKAGCEQVITSLEPLLDAARSL
ncbi:SAV_2336 N-terminal domain-related protein [Streptomyces sp. NPDC046909]|uniref:SAV_2336 N-terminal domain-related protein n=1 Tax=Streptomyces sp. NPDC046909 TaxID=3155617 RepID=UPI00340CA1DD